MDIENFNRDYEKFTWENMVKILEALNVSQPKREFIIYRPLTEEEKASIKQNKKYFKK